MRASAALAVLLLFAGSAVAQEAKPDYSRDTLMRIFTADTQRPENEPRIRYRVGAVDFRALGTTWRFIYLPIMMPLSGTRLGVTQEWPDPFALTGTVIATSPRAWSTHRARNAELKRIERTEKQRRAKVKVQPD